MSVENGFVREEERLSGARWIIGTHIVGRIREFGATESREVGNRHYGFAWLQELRNFFSSVLHRRLDDIEMCRESAVRFPRCALDHVSCVLRSPQRLQLTAVRILKLFYLKLAQDLIGFQQYLRLFIVIVESDYDVLDFI